MDEFSESYQYIPYLKYRIMRRHLKVDSIIDSLPSPELIKKDAYFFSELSKKYGCLFGCGYPISYLMTVDYSLGIDLSIYEEVPSYYISIASKREETTFSKEEFIESVKKEKGLIKKMI